MAEITGAPTAALMIGGKTASGGAKKGIYRVKVKEANAGVSKEKGTPFLDLVFIGCKDTENPQKEGKKVHSQRVYFPHPDKSPEDQQVIKGRIKRMWFTPLGITWPEDEKQLDTRLFLNKECFIALDYESSPQEGYDARIEVKSVVGTKKEDADALEKLRAKFAGKADEASSESTEEKTPPKKKASAGVR